MNFVTNEQVGTCNVSSHLSLGLHWISLLPPSDKGSVALMAAKSEIRGDIQDYLEELQVPFSLLGNTHYQSWHVGRVLTYYRLIVNRHQDAEVEQLLRYCIAPYLDFRQVNCLKEIAQKNEQPLFNVVADSEVLKQLDISTEQEEALRQHLAIIQTFDPDSSFSDVWQAITELEGGPLAMDDSEKQQQEELKSVLEKFENSTVAEALEHIHSHITYLEERHEAQRLIVTTIDHAKSQAFDTVFLLGAHSLKQRQRWYVSVSRARERCFFLVDGQSFESEEHPVTRLISSELYDEFSWP